MKKIITTFILSFTFIWCYAQQEHQYTQFMFNKLGHNPGYAGSKDGACLTGIYRSQWMGLEGAPNSQLLSFNMPLLNKRIGVGVNLSRSLLDISVMTTQTLGYKLLKALLQMVVYQLERKVNTSPILE